jgi:hypothetical protein
MWKLRIESENPMLPTLPEPECPPPGIWKSPQKAQNANQMQATTVSPLAATSALELFGKITGAHASTSGPGPGRAA